MEPWGALEGNKLQEGRPQRAGAASSGGGRSLSRWWQRQAARVMQQPLPGGEGRRVRLPGGDLAVGFQGLDGLALKGEPGQALAGKTTAAFAFFVIGMSVGAWRPARDDRPHNPCRAPGPIPPQPALRAPRRAHHADDFLLGGHPAVRRSLVGGDQAAGRRRCCAVSRGIGKPGIRPSG